MINTSNWLYYEYEGTVKQNAGGGGALVIRFTPGKGNEMIIKHYKIGPNDYSGPETVATSILDSEDNEVLKLDLDSDYDNNKIYGPNQSMLDTPDDLESTPEKIGSPPDSEIVVKGEHYLKFSTSALAQNEELTVFLSALVRRGKPTVATTGSGGTPALTTAQERMI
jgi:hypothetical protein